MRINGEWLVCDDGIIRPVLQGFVQLADGSWKGLVLLLDGGADRTVLSADFLNPLQPLAMEEAEITSLAGVGGIAESITVETAISFMKDDGRRVAVRGPLSVFTEMGSADLSVLGRDVTNNFSVIYDYPSRTVTLLAAPHSYEVKSS